MTSRARLIARLRGSTDSAPVVAAVAGTALPVVLDLLVSGSRRAFAYLAADAFYYLEVAKNTAEHGRVSFDGTRPTNGFHPLWQLCEAALWRGCQFVGLSEARVLVVVVLVGVFLLSGAVVLFARALRHVYGRVPVSFAFVPVGLYAALLLPLWVTTGYLGNGDNPVEGPMPLYGTLWSYANGMETPLVIAIYALIVVVFVKATSLGRRTTLAMGGLLSLVALARLDLVMLAVAYCFVVLAIAGAIRSRALARHVCWVGLCVMGTLGAYVVINRAYSGTWLPISGTLKSRFPHPIGSNLRGLTGLFNGRDQFYSRSRLYRVGPNLIGGGVAITWLIARVPSLRRRSRNRSLDLDEPGTRYDVVLASTALSVLLVGAYDVLFVPEGQQGHWYWPVTTVFVSLAGLDLWQRRARTRAAAVPGRRSVAVSAVIALLGLAVFMSLGHPSQYHDRYADFFFTGATDVKAFYAGRTEPRLLAVDDGIDAFSLGYPSMSGSGLVLDADAVDAWRSGHLVKLALARGFDRISSVAYLDATNLTPTTPADEVRARVASILPNEDLSGLRFTVEYSSMPGTLATHVPNSDGRYVLIRVASAG